MVVSVDRGWTAGAAGRDIPKKYRGTALLLLYRIERLINVTEFRLAEYI